MLSYPISTGQIVKARRTEALLAEPVAFCKLLRAAVMWHRDWCKRRGVRCFVRPNVLSDIPWELFYPELMEGWGKEVIFYDYTKIPGRSSTRRWNTADYPYHLTYSYAGGEASLTNTKSEIARGIPSAIVFYLGEHNEFIREGRKKAPWSRGPWRDLKFQGYPVYDGDCHDLRPLDPSEALVVGLQYKQPVSKKQRPEDPTKSAFLVYAEKTEIELSGRHKSAWIMPASGRQLGSLLFKEPDVDLEIGQ
jgi:hypothetical protein